MDYTIEIDKVKQELLSIGFTEEKYNQILALAMEESIDLALLDLQEKDDEAYNQMDQNIPSQITTEEEAAQFITQLFLATYGEQADEMKGKFIYEYLQKTLEDTKKTKDLYERYQAGDPTAVAAVNANKDNPEIQEIINQQST
ncbi:MAG: hypothetical protein PHE21_01840 [Candidatus Dojkabacteria bacterium]|nr:hypothetical protein [Candidatus Dojkabacteria bacterium]